MTPSPSVSLEDTIATALKEAPEQGDWPWEDHCEGVAMFVAGALRAAGVVPAEPASHDTRRWKVVEDGPDRPKALECEDDVGYSLIVMDPDSVWPEHWQALIAAVAAVDGEAPAT